MPKTIYRRGHWFCFKMTNALGKRIEIKSLTEKEARLKLLKMPDQIFSSMAEKPSYRVSFEQGIEFWLRAKKGSIDETSYLRYKGYLKNFTDFLGVIYPKLIYFDEIKPEHIKEFMLYRVNEQGRATKTVNSERQALYNLFSVLIDNNKIPENNPVSKVKPFKIIKVQNRRCLSDKELYRFLEGAKAEIKDGINWYAIYLTLYITGMRRDEVRKLVKENVDLSNNFIKIMNTKTDKPKIIPLHPQLKPILKQAIESARGKLIFPNFDGKILPKNKIRDKMLKICEKVGILKATVHDLRHTFASRNGLSDRAKQVIGGWSSKLVMEKTYIHPPEDDIRNEYFSVNFMPKPKD
ncbi:MAG: site-specific integrase [Candidatus Omnitrophota bacterium]